MKLESPVAVMMDMLSVSCNRYSSGQTPVRFYTRFENGRAIGIQRARRLAGRLLKSRDPHEGLGVIFEEALRQVKADGYGEVCLEEVALDDSTGLLTVGIRLPNPTCENEIKLSNREGLCRCYLWFWRGILNGLACEVGWTIMKLRAGRLAPETLRPQGRRLWEAKAKATVREKRFYSSIVVQLEI